MSYQEKLNREKIMKRLAWSIADAEDRNDSVIHVGSISMDLPQARKLFAHLLAQRNQRVERGQQP